MDWCHLTEEHILLKSPNRIPQHEVLAIQIFFPVAAASSEVPGDPPNCKPGFTLPLIHLSTPTSCRKETSAEPPLPSGELGSPPSRGIYSRCKPHGLACLQDQMSHSHANTHTQKERRTLEMCQVNSDFSSLPTHQASMEFRKDLNPALPLLGGLFFPRRSHGEFFSPRREALLNRSATP